ncbi:hypothetical protein DCM91_16255 [Chitinophaga costaii]|nr:hypothetical protein DCM91_16255 [Chitinophaga costaii]
MARLPSDRRPICEQQYNTTAQGAVKKHRKERGILSTGMFFIILPFSYHRCNRCSGGIIYWKGWYGRVFLEGTGVAGVYDFLLQHASEAISDPSLNVVMG